MGTGMAAILKARGAAYKAGPIKSIRSATSDCGCAGLSARWRTGLLGTAAAGVLAFAVPEAVQAQTVVPPSAGPCIVVGTTAMCTGNVSAGVSASDPLTTLNVNSLTQNIAPGAGVDGVEFVVTSLVDQSITVNVDTGAFAISVQNAVGIDAQLGTFANNLNGNVTVTSIGDITTTGSDGINADLFGTGNIYVKSTGNITGPSSQGIDASHEGGSGNITVVSVGNITSDGEGINAFNRLDGTVYISSVGNIRADGIGLDARTATGDVTVLSTGNITTTNGREGIEANSQNGNVTVTSVGDITTPGDEGIEADVTGNGKIVITSTGNITALFEGADDGDEGISAKVGGTGSITITSTGDITTDGDADSDGILGRMDGAGNVTINSTGNITTTGADGVEALVQAGSTATVTLAGGTVSGGTGVSAGVNFSGGAGSTNILNVKSDATVSARSGIAVQGAAGNETVNNDGTLTGAVDLGEGANTIDNRSGGTITGTISTGAGNDTVTNSGMFTGTFDLGGGLNVFNNVAGGVLNSGATLSVGAGNRLNNAGTVSPGGSGTVDISALTGNLVQTGAGTLAVDVDPTARTADRFTVTGTADVDGTVDVTVINPARGAQSSTILSAAGGVTDSGLALGPTSPALQASLSFPNANDVVLNTSIDFSAGGLNPNQTNIGRTLNTALDSGQGGLAPILDALLTGVFTVADYRRALDQLSPEAFLNTETATLFSAESSIGDLFSCRIDGRPFAAVGEGQCLWARPKGRFLDRDSDATTIGFDDDSGGLSAGGQVSVAPNWYAGLALAYERGSLNTDSGASSDADRFSAGASLKFQNGPFLLAVAFGGGIGNYDTRRPISFGGINVVGKSEHNVNHFSGQVRAAYLFEHEDWFAKPLVDLNVTHLSRNGVTETGAGAANLTVTGGSDTFVSITPGIEVGGTFRLSDSGIIRPYVAAGISYYTESSHGLSARFANAPTGTDAFSIRSGFDDVFADVAAGATAIFKNGSTLGLAYEGLISSDTQQHGISLKGTITF